MTEVFRESPELHDAHVEEFIPEGARALPTINTPGYTYFKDYKGRNWLCCTCVRDFLTYAQRVALKRGLLKQGFDIWQLTGGAAASAGTHTQGGAFDLLYQTSDAWVKFFRDLGATATWRRTTAQGFSAQHLHGVLNGCVHNSPARYQVVEQKSGPPTGGGDGLTGTKPDYHPDPNPYRTWDAGVLAMKKELGLLALTTTTTLSISSQPMSKGAYASTSAVTSQPGTAYASGTHVYEYLPTGSTVWKAFHQVAVVKGRSSFFWNYGSAQPIRVRYVPTNAQVSKASSSAQIAPQVVDVAELRSQNSALTSQVAALKTLSNAQAGDIAALKAEIERLKAGTANPPEPVPAFGVDVSGHQTVERVQALVADKANDFVIVKATEGLDFRNSLYGQQVVVSGPKFIGSYHYTGTPGNAALDEAENFLRTAVTGLLALDVETAVTPTFVLQWLDVVRARRGLLPLVYTNWAWLKPLRAAATVEQWDRLVEYPLWLAEVRLPGQHSTVDPKPGSTKPWPVLVHQYAYTPDDTGKGIDRDWTPDLARLRALAGLT